MAKYRKKPVVIEAEQYHGDNESVARIRSFVGKELHGNGRDLFIETWESIHIVRPGDWVIREVTGDNYPCKPDIFEATYEPISHLLPLRCSAEGDGGGGEGKPGFSYNRIGRTDMLEVVIDRDCLQKLYTHLWESEYDPDDPVDWKPILKRVEEILEKSYAEEPECQS